MIHCLSCCCELDHAVVYSQIWEGQDNQAKLLVNVARYAPGLYRDAIFPGAFPAWSRHMAPRDACVPDQWGQRGRASEPLKGPPDDQCQNRCQEKNGSAEV